MQKKPRKKLGRPSLYKPEYCEMLIEHRSQGLSFESFAGVVKTHVDTLYEWASVHEAFSEAKKDSDALCRLWWEKKGIAGMTGKIYDFSASMWVFNMKARWGWRDGSEVGRQTISKREFKIEWADDADNPETGPKNTASEED